MQSSLFSYFKAPAGKKEEAACKEEPVKDHGKKAPFPPAKKSRAVAVAVAVAPVDLPPASLEPMVELAEVPPAEELPSLLENKADINKGIDVASDYELRRQQNMQRNAEFLRQLGLADLQSSLGSGHTPTPGPPAVKRTKLEARPIAPILPTRRSTRHISAPVSYVDSTGAATAGDDGSGESESDDDVADYDDSDVLKYVLSNGSEDYSGSSVGGYISTAEQGAGIKLCGGGMHGLSCDDLAAVYSMHALESLPSLLLAAGKGGQAVIFRLPRARDRQATKGIIDDFPDEAKSQGQEGNVLMSFRAHSKWIGSAKLLQNPNYTYQQTGTGASTAGLYVASCSDDSIVKIWDVSVSKEVSGGRNVNKHPYLAAETREAHSRGIYAMDICGGTSMLTGSKDKTVSVSEIYYSGSPTRASVELRRISQFHLHGGVVKTVAWQSSQPIDDIAGSGRNSPNVFSSGGADNCVVIKDIRSGDRSDLVINGIYQRGGVHTVSWSPEPDQPNMLLAAGFEDSLKIFDIRKATAESPLFEYRGHCSHSKSSRPNNNLQTPSFIARKYCVAVPGSGNQTISLYSTVTGKCLSRGEMLDETNAIYCLPSTKTFGDGDGGKESLSHARIVVSCKRGGIMHPFDVCGAP